MTDPREVPGHPELTRHDPASMTGDEHRAAAIQILEQMGLATDPNGTPWITGSINEEFLLAGVLHALLAMTAPTVLRIVEAGVKSE